MPYAEDSASQYEHLSAQPWFVFLDSCVPRAPLGRYDILAARPRATLCTRGGVTAVREGDDLQLSDADPIKLLRERLGPREPPVGDLPFAGGALGYFAYDLGRRFERLPERAERDIDLPDMAVGVYD
ncbi:MAG: aminodeoxychorismate synthase component I, partial [Pseudomonadota bacterium]